MYGMGNWNEIAEHVGTGKTSQQCHDHYVTDYLLSPCAPVPVRIVECLIGSSGA